MRRPRRRPSRTGRPSGSKELPPPDIIAQEIVEDLQAALSEFAAVAEALQVARTDAE